MNLLNLKETAVSYALSNGLLHGEIIDGKQYYTHMPISLFPFVVFIYVIVCKELVIQTELPSWRKVE